MLWHQPWILCIRSDFKFISKSMHMTISPGSKYEQIQNLKFHLLPITIVPYYLVFSYSYSPVICFTKVNCIPSSRFTHFIVFFVECLDTPIWLEMSVITYLITLISYLRIAHWSANLSGRLCVFFSWSLRIPFNAGSPMLRETLFANHNFSMLWGILARCEFLISSIPNPHLLESILLWDKLIGASPLTKCHFSHYLFWLRRILWGMGGGGLKKGGNALRATESLRCKSSAS